MTTDKRITQMENLTCWAFEILFWFPLFCFLLFYFVSFLVLASNETTTRLTQH